jgi:hypothetical protein
MSTPARKVTSQSKRTVCEIPSLSVRALAGRLDHTMDSVGSSSPDHHHARDLAPQEHGM